MKHYKKFNDLLLTHLSSINKTVLRNKSIKKNTRDIFLSFFTIIEKKATFL